MTSEVKNRGEDDKKRKEDNNVACKKIIGEEIEKNDEDYWEEMLFISRGPNAWNIGCGCG